jgi:hypothetical protein
MKGAALPDWIIEPGRITHAAAPRFAAAWTTGQAPPGPCWTDEGSGGDDRIHIYELAWRDPPPDDAATRALMGDAARALDAWIARRL